MAIMGINGTLRGQGEARKTSYVSLTYSVANWALDPILITGAFGIGGFGVAGAAYATIAGFFIAILVALWLIKGARLQINPTAIRECDLGASSKAILSVAGPAAFSNAINPIGLSVLTALIAPEGQSAIEYRADMVRDRAATVPLGRLAVAADIAKTAAFLASSESDYLTGQSINVAGGYEKRQYRL